MKNECLSRNFTYCHKYTQNWIVYMKHTYDYKNKVKLILIEHLYESVLLNCNNKVIIIQASRIQ